MTLQEMLKQFRTQVLQITLKQMSEKTGINIKTLSAFENGRSNNINHLKKYYDSTDCDIQKQTLIYNISEVLKHG